MKKYVMAIVVAASLLASCGPTQVVVKSAPPPPPPPPPPTEAPYQVFYDELSPYGHWIDYPGYGYVFMPNVGPDFKPYATNGHWVYTNEGWAWASDYNWGWATFHYGRWFYEDGYGWMWIPGHEWAPAWVAWRRSPDYYGWAPLGPGVSVTVSVGGGYNPPAHYWSFVPHQYIAHPHVNNYYVHESNNVTIINNTTIINNHINNNVTNTTVNNHIHNNYAGGPDPREVETVTGAPVRPLPLRESNKPGEQLQNGQLAIYRPRANAAAASIPGNNNAAGRPSNPAPRKIESLAQVRPINAVSYKNNNVPIANNNNGNNHPDASNNINNNKPITNEKPPINNNQNNQPAAINQPLNNVRPGNNNPAVINNQPAAINQPPNSVRPGNNNPAVMNNQPVTNSPVTPPRPPMGRPQPVKDPVAANNGPGNLQKNTNLPGIGTRKMNPVNTPVNSPANNPRPLNRPVPQLQQKTVKPPVPQKNKPVAKPGDKPTSKFERKKDENNK